MSIFDIERVADPTIPVWINNEGYAERYDTIGQAIDKGCYGEYSYVPYGQEPCESCCHYHVSKYKPKPEEIQVGDEVEHNGCEKAVVFRVTEQMVYALYQMPENPFSTLIRCEWYKSDTDMWAGHNRICENLEEYIGGKENEL